MKKVLAFSLFFLFFIGKTLATHIVGGEIIYDRINDSTYRIILKIYRDCNSNVPFDGVTAATNIPALITVYEGDSTLVGSFDIGSPVVSNIPPSINHLCIQTPTTICVQEGVYTYTLVLPPKVGGYYVIYQNCCRNGSINNLSPTLQTASYYTFIPGPETAPVNSSPRFIKFPPIFICNKVDFTFDHSATDPDGDQLVYSLCEPFQGANLTCAGCPSIAAPPPYPNVTYLSPYNGAYPIPSSPAFSINPTTGILGGRPNLTGQFAVGVCVQEFRGGILIDTHFRDFQFNVVPCVVQAVSVFADQESRCEGSTITFTNQSFGSNTSLNYFWDFGVPSITSDTSYANSPSYTYQDTGTYIVTLIANPNKPCSDTIKKMVYVYPQLQVNFPPVAKQCFKNNSFNFSAQGVYLPYASFNWDFTPAATPSLSTLNNPANITFNQPGKYFVTLIAKQLTCIDTFIDSIRVVAPPIAKINNDALSLCDPATVGFINGSSSELPVSYTWLFSNGSNSTAFEPSQIFTPPGVYTATLIVKTNTVCIDSSIAVSNSIIVNPSPNAGFTFSPQITTIFDPEITFSNTASQDVTAWHYNFDDGLSTTNSGEIHTYLDYGDYTVIQTVINTYSCTDTSMQIVKILPEFRFWIPNTFTPNKDMLNDIFMPVLIGVTNYEFNVFSRWGEEIFNTKDTKEGWDGSHSGKVCQDGLYAWRIVFNNVVSSQVEVHYGHVILLRN